MTHWRHSGPLSYVRTLRQHYTVYLNSIYYCLHYRELRHISYHYLYIKNAILLLIVYSFYTFILWHIYIALLKENKEHMNTYNYDLQRLELIKHVINHERNLRLTTPRKQTLSLSVFPSIPVEAYLCFYVPLIHFDWRLRLTLSAQSSPQRD